MVPNREFNSGSLQDLLSDDPEGFLMVVAAKYHLFVNTGTEAESALLYLVWELAEEGINLPRVLNRYPELTQSYFGDHPEIPEGLVDDIDRVIENADW